MAQYDLKITNGTIVDGSGKAGYQGSVAIKDGKIVAVGDCPGSADRSIDAEGHLIAPGFVDIHTHYDGQISWDSDMAPSSVHGVTTCVMGSCGVGFAPVHKTDHERLIKLMEGVEDIPGSALAEGLTWDWESFPEYMSAIDKLPHSIDFCAQVPHDALRVYVMGQRALAEEEATDKDIERMRQLVREALDAGAIGFSTGRSDNHRTADGDPTPASEAHVRELTGIAKAFAGVDHGMLQAVNDFNLQEHNEVFDYEWDVLEKMVAASDGTRFSLSLMQRDQCPRQWQQIMERVEQGVAKGLHMRMQVAPRGIGVMLGLEATFNPFMGFPSYQSIAGKSLEERVAAMRDPQFRTKLLSEKSLPVSGDGSALPPLADLLLAQLDMVAKRLYKLGERPNYEPGKETCLFAKAMGSGKTVMETLYDAMLDEDGHALLYFPLYNYTEMNLDNVRTMLEHPLSLPGLSDGGAHVGTVCDASFPTFLLSHWGRDRKSGRFPVEQLIKMQCHDTAQHAGLTDRGLLAPGYKADINVIDFDSLALDAPRLHGDLPAGGKRLLQGARGYKTTLVSGTVIAENGQLTGAYPGRLVRSGQLG